MINAHLKLGKKPLRHDSRTIMMARYMSPAALPPPPASKGYTSKVPKWPMMLNDTLGDCTCACAGHMEQLWTANESTMITAPDSAIESMYEAVGGYVPGDPSTDNGAVILDVLKYWKSTGLAGRKITGYMGVNPLKSVEIQDSVYLFGACYLGVDLPLSVQDADIWEVPPEGLTGDGTPGSWGGHAIPIVEYDSRGVTVVTWGELMRVTWGFIVAYCTEAWAVLSSEWALMNKPAPNKFNFTQLNADLVAIANA